MTEQHKAASTAAREIVMTRTFDAPRELVFKAWTDPKHVDQWWGPNGFRNETFEMAVQPGGRWRYVMHGPDGRDYDNRIVYHEVVAPERLVYTHGHDMDNDPEAFEVTVTFTVQGEQTLLTMHTRFKTVAQRDEVAKFAIVGNQQTMKRLETHLIEMSTMANDSALQATEWELVITRIFDAPSELVFNAWIDPALVVGWWGPEGFTTTISEMNVRPGGLWKFVLHGPDGVDYKNEIVFRAIEAPMRLVYDHVTGPKYQAWVTFNAQGNQTEATLQMRLETPVVKKMGIDEGAKQMFGRLATQLAQTMHEKN